MAAGERRVFRVRQGLLIAVSLVGRRHHDRLYLRGPPARLQDIPCALNVALKREHGVAVGDAHDGLRGQMKNGVDLVLAQDALDKVAIPHIAADDIHRVEGARADQLAARHPVAHQANHLGLGREQAAGEPAAQQARSAGDQRGPVAPVGWIDLHVHIFQGAWPLFQRSLSNWLSRYVSMAWKKPWWL